MSKKFITAVKSSQSIIMDLADKTVTIHLPSMQQTQDCADGIAEILQRGTRYVAATLSQRQKSVSLYYAPKQPMQEIW